MSDIFISYAREDSEFVRKLVDSLQADNREVWVDFNDIPFGTEWWEEIVEAIEKSPVGIFVISEDSIESQYCSLEIAQLFQNQKKMVPIVARKPSEEAIEDLPGVIRDLNWISFDGTDYDSNFASLLETIDTDLSAGKEHTRLLVRALDWQKNGHSKDMLSRGDELAGFLPMLEQDDLTAGQQAFLDESLRAAQARYNFWRFVFGFLGGLFSFAFYITTAYRGSIFNPAALALIIAAGEVFGLFTGIIAVLGSSLPEFMKKHLPSVTYMPIRITVCLLAGMLTWIVFQWIFLSLPLVPTWASFFGGIGISIGFIINAYFKPPAVVTFGVTAIAYFATMFLLNSLAPFYVNSGLENPLIYFDSATSIYTIGLPMVLLFAVGTNAHILWQAIFGGNTVTQYLEGRSSGRKKKALVLQSEPEMLPGQ